MKNVLVTGATGFTGGHLVKRLVSEGARVRAFALPDMDTRALQDQGVTVFAGDLRKAETLAPAVQGVDIVFHIAAVYREEGIPKKMFWDVNVEGTRNLLAASHDAGVKRFVHCSTVGVQGEIAHPPAKEDAPYNPGDHYQESKMEGEKLALQFFESEGLPGVIFRPVGIYGPGDTRFLKIFRWVEHGTFRMFGSGNVLYHMTYIDDLVDGILLAAQTPGIEGEIFTLAGAAYTTLNELVQIVAEVLGKTVSARRFPIWPVWAAGAVCEFICRPLGINPPLYRRRVDFFVKDRAFDITKARQMLGYNPKVDLRTGIARTAEWYKKNNML